MTDPVSSQWHPFKTIPLGVYCVVLVDNSKGTLLPHIAIRESVCGQDLLRYWSAETPKEKPLYWLALPNAPTLPPKEAA